MASRSVAVAVTLSVLCAVGAIGAYIQGSRYRTDADALLTRGEAEGLEYAATFEGVYADKQEETLDARRLVLHHAHRWQRAQMVLILCTVVGAFISYLLYLLARLHAQLLDGQLDEEERPLSEADLRSR